ncbi:MAG: tetratricopeptide repeat protein [Opitutales bacterium]|nr:tetratricopeptide repeat protein [Opitutales bacterium]
MRKFLKIIAAALCASAACAAQAQTPVPPENDVQKNKILSAEAAAENARKALEIGMPVLSASLAEGVVSNPEASEEEVDAARFILADSLIAQGAFESAQKILSLAKNQYAPETLVRRAIVLSQLGDAYGAREIISKLSPDALPENLRAWFFVARGRILFDEGNFGSASDDFAAAKNFAKSDAIKREADSLINLCRMSEELGAKSMEAFASELSLKSSLFMGTNAGVQFAKQYAVLLNRLGRRQDALSAIENALNIALMPDIDRDELTLLAASIEPSQERKRAMVENLLKTTKSPAVTEQAIFLLRASFGDDSDAYAEMLNRARASASQLIMDRILLELAYICIRKNDFAGVAKYAETLLKDYPASAFKVNACGALAWAAFSSGENKKPEYRQAARYLMEMAGLEKNPKMSDFIRFIAADCYFLEGDFDTSGAMYKLLIDSNLSERWKGGAFARAAESFLNLGDLQSAVALADSSYSRLALNPDDVWKTEWSIASLYTKRGEISAARKRLEKLLKTAVNQDANQDLRAKMLWLEARLAESDADYVRSLELSENILAQLKSGALKPSAEAAKMAASNAMLIRARSLAALERFDGEDGAFDAYEKLRAEYPASDAAQISYLYEARNFALRGAYAQAQQHCKTLADTFPNGKYAPDALYDAASYSRKLGLESDYKEALILLSRLAEKYPQSPKIFFAKIAQAEILRLMGDFANAAAMYKNIIAEYESHPQIKIAYMGLGDCLLAQPASGSDAAMMFERIYSMPDVKGAAKAEAAFKWGFALERLGRYREAAEVWWISANEILSPKARQKGETDAKERYWVARTLLELAKTFETMGENSSAVAAYELLARHNLPGGRNAKLKLLNLKKEK